MTAEPEEPVEPPPDDLRDQPPDPDAGDDSDTDAMGIDDDDPIDRTLVGEPVDADEEPPD